jgi:hypothetical protein
MEKLMKVIIFIYYTDGYYEKIINQYLLPSLQKFNLPNKIYTSPNQHDWLKNGKQKFKIIYEHLINNNQNVVFLDADAEIIKSPELFYQISDDYDIGVHYLDWYLFWRNQPNKNKRELLGATIYINNNDKTKDLFKTLYEQTKNSSEWGQKILQTLIENNYSLKVYNLPIEYCYIKKEGDNFYSGYATIVQHQASRKIRKRQKIL